MKPSSSLIGSAFLVTGESVFWEETDVVQFPELPAKTTCSRYQWHLQKGKFHLYHPFRKMLSSHLRSQLNKQCKQIIE